MKSRLLHWISAGFDFLSPAKFGCFSLAVSFMCMPYSVYAATIPVDTNIPDISLGDGACSLVEAINEAQAPGSSGGDCVTGDTGPDTIELYAEGPYRITSVDNDTDGPNGLPSITTTITINGHNEIIERGFPIREPPLLRIFHVASTGQLQLNQLTVHNGRMQDPVEIELGYSGGGIYNKGDLMLSGCTLSNNSAGDFSGGGGALYNAESATANLSDSVVEHNGPDAIRNRGVMTIVRSTVRFNGGEGSGTIGNSNDMKISDSLIHSNFQEVDAAAIGSVGSLVVTNTTVTGNQSVTFIGGVAVEVVFAEIINSTIADNTNILGRNSLQIAGPVILRNTIVYSSELTDSLCMGDVMSMGHNIANDDSCNLTAIGDQPNTDPMLGELADNGGPTMTRALLPESPAIDGGEIDCTDANGDPLLADQRGAPRPVDGNGDGFTACDVGAFEVQPLIGRVDIDIRPFAKKNIINPRSRGTIWVAVLSDTDAGSAFDPSSQLDVSTVEFGPDGASAIRHKVWDINKDGLSDLLLRFRIRDTGIDCGDPEAALIGATFGGQPIRGADSIKTVGCKKKHHKNHHRKHHKNHHKKHHDAH